MQHNFDLNLANNEPGGFYNSFDASMLASQPPSEYHPIYYFQNFHLNFQFSPDLSYGYSFEPCQCFPPFSFFEPYAWPYHSAGFRQLISISCNYPNPTVMSSLDSPNSIDSEIKPRMFGLPNDSYFPPNILVQHEEISDSKKSLQNNLLTKPNYDSTHGNLIFPSDQRYHSYTNGEINEVGQNLIFSKNKGKSNNLIFDELSSDNADESKVL